MTRYVVVYVWRDPTKAPKRAAILPFNPEYPSSRAYAESTAYRVRQLYELQGRQVASVVEG